MTESKPGTSPSTNPSPPTNVPAPLPGRASDPAAVSQQLARTGEDASELSGLTGTDLASYALARPDGRLSRSDLNRIALSLLQEAAGGAKPDLRASAAILASLITLNAPKQTGSAKPVSPQRDLSRYVERSTRGLPSAAPPRRTIDVPAEPDDKP